MCKGPWPGNRLDYITKIIHKIRIKIVWRHRIRHTLNRFTTTTDFIIVKRINEQWYLKSMNAVSCTEIPITTQYTIMNNGYCLTNLSKIQRQPIHNKIVSKLHELMMFNDDNICDLWFKRCCQTWLKTKYSLPWLY